MRIFRQHGILEKKISVSAAIASLDMFAMIVGHLSRIFFLINLQSVHIIHIKPNGTAIANNLIIKATFSSWYISRMSILQKNSI